MSIPTHTIGAILHRLSPFVSAALFLVAMAIVYHEIEVYHWSEIKLAIVSISGSYIMYALGLTVLSYLILSFYDWLAMEYAGERLPYRNVLLASFLGYAVSNNVGHALFSGGAIRYRLYSSWGIRAGSITRIVLFCAATYVIGAVTLLVSARVFLPPNIIITDKLSEHTLTIVFILACISLVAWWLLVIFYRKPLRIKRFILPLPSLTLTIQQTFIALLDIFVASLVLFILLSHNVDIPLHSFVMLFILAQLTGLLSQVPGGIGVFEGSFLFLTSTQFPASNVLGALIVFRIVYYFIPLSFAGISLLCYEWRLRQNKRLSPHYNSQNTPL